MSSEKLEFLENQVFRLNSILAQYQQKYPAIDVEDEVSVPWVTDKGLMSPLLNEYDRTLADFQKKATACDSELNLLQEKVEALTLENSRLNQELKEAVKLQIDNANTAVDSSGKFLPSDDATVQNLQMQLQHAIQEKEALNEMWQASSKVTEKLEEDLQALRLSPHVMSVEAEANKLKKQYGKTVAEFTQEINSLTEQLSEARKELTSSNAKVGHLQAKIVDCELYSKRTKQETDITHNEKESLSKRLDEISEINSQLEAEKHNAVNLIDSLQKEKHTLEQKFKQISKENSVIEARGYEAAIQVKDSVQIAQNAILEKDQALIREQQRQEEIEMLQKSMSELIDEAGARTKQEVDIIKTQCNKNIDKLLEEINFLELSNDEKAAQLERLLREKRAAESELEKIYEEGRVISSNDANTYDELTRRACYAERLHDEANMKLDSIQNENRRIQMMYEKDKSTLNKEIEQLKTRISNLNIDFDNANEDRLKLTEETDELKRKLLLAETERDKANRKSVKEIACMKKELEQDSRRLQVKLQAKEDTHRQAVTELRKMLSDQQRITAKWKEDSSCITHKFENQISDYQGEISRLKNRITELSRLLKESADKTLQAEQMMAEYSSHIKRMEQRIQNAEIKANKSTIDMTNYLKRENSKLFDISINKDIDVTQESNAISDI